MTALTAVFLFWQPALLPYLRSKCLHLGCHCSTEHVKFPLTRSYTLYAHYQDAFSNERLALLLRYDCNAQTV